MDNEFSLSPEEAEAACRTELPVQVIHGLELFNQGAYFEAHEELELACAEITAVPRKCSCARGCGWNRSWITVSICATGFAVELIWPVCTAILRVSKKNCCGWDRSGWSG
jgi:hypothetical protein